VAPALGFTSLAFPSKGHTVKGALPQLGAMVGIPPGLVRARLDEIGELMAYPQLERTPIALMESQRKRQLILAMALAVDPDVLLFDIRILPTPFGERCAQRIEALRERGALVVAEMRNPRKMPLLTPDRIVTLRSGRLADLTP
jgi:ABC-type polysaccharide/polyol phosphate transport system ATPase subunit